MIQQLYMSKALSLETAEGRERVRWYIFNIKMIV